MKKSDLKQLIEEVFQEMVSDEKNASQSSSNYAADSDLGRGEDSLGFESSQDFQAMIKKFVELENGNQRGVSELKKSSALTQKEAQAALMRIMFHSNFMYFLSKLVLTRHYEPEVVVPFINRASRLLYSSNILKHFHQKSNKTLSHKK